MKNIKSIVFILSALMMVANTPSFGQDKNKSNLVISGQGWYGYDVEKLHPNQTSFGYMTYDLGLGFQTQPESGKFSI